MEIEYTRCQMFPKSVIKIVIPIFQLKNNYFNFLNFFYPKQYFALYIY